MKELKELQKIEAIERMKKLKLPLNVISDFENDDTIYCSEYPHNRLINPKEKDIIDKYIEWSDCFVYHIIHSYSNIGETYELLTVSNYIEDWSYEHRYLEKGIILVYAENLSRPENSESGSIMVENIDGTLYRIG